MFSLVRPAAFAAILVSVSMLSAVLAQDYTPPTQTAVQSGASAGAQPPYQVAERSNPTRQPLSEILRPSGDNEHPLMPAVRWANTEIKNVAKIKDYSAVLVKRERVGTKLRDEEYMFLKVRHNPLSVYMYFLKPKGLEGREVIYKTGGADGPKMYAHGTGLEKLVGTLELDPNGILAMQGQRYPISEIGILNLVQRLIEVAEQDVQYGECDVKFFPGANLNGRSCTCIQVVHPVPRRNFLFYLARIFVDEELNLPLRYEAYDWPKEEGGPPELIEQYTYMNLKLNNGFTDADFDTANPNYAFPGK